MHVCLLYHYVMGVVLFLGARCLFSGNAGDAVDDAHLVLIDDRVADWYTTPVFDVAYLRPRALICWHYHVYICACWQWTAVNKPEW